MISIGLAYFVTLCLFPGIESEIISCRLHSWMPIILITIFNLFDFIGKVRNSKKFFRKCIDSFCFFCFFLLQRIVVLDNRKYPRISYIYTLYCINPISMATVCPYRTQCVSDHLDYPPQINMKYLFPLLGSLPHSIGHVVIQGLVTIPVRKESQH